MGGSLPRGFTSQGFSTSSSPPKTHFNTCLHPKNSKYQNSFQYVLSSPKLKMQELKTTSKLTPKKHPTTRNPNPHFEARFEFVTTFIKKKDYTK